MDLDKKLLSICIPTYNRANYLKQSLLQIHKELTSDLFSKIEVLVSDNCSTDNTSEVIDILKNQGLDINYIRNNENLGWGMNFLQCFELANSKYVLLLGDDDVLYDNSINIIIKALQSIEIGVLTFKCFGYDNDWKSERPFSFSKEHYFNDSIKYIYNIGPDITMISSCVINKDFIDIEKIKKYPIGNFAHVHLILTSALEAKNNLFISNYLVGAKRDNSSDYHFSLVFVKEIWNIFKMYKLSGLNHKVVKNLQNKWLFIYYPFYWLKQRLDSSNDYLDSLLHCDEVFKGNLLYYIWNRPILASPKYFAIFWGVITTFIGRSLNGELSKGFLFLFKKNKLIKLFF